MNVKYEHAGTSFRESGNFLLCENKFCNAANVFSVFKMKFNK